VFLELRTQYQEKGDAERSRGARAARQAGNLSVADRERLFGFLEAEGG